VPRAACEMRILLQNTDTRSYVRSVGQWTPQLIEAHAFRTSLEALCFCHNQGLFHMQVILSFRGALQDIAFPVTDARLA
jgi:hypothetical protein